MKGNGNRNGPVVLVSRSIDYTFPVAYGYLAGYLKQQGEDVRVLFRPARREWPGLIKSIMESRPLLVGFGSLYPELAEIRDLVCELNRAGRQFPVVVGGQMVSPIPEFAVKITGAEYGVMGEGEITLSRLVATLRDDASTSGIRGLAIRNGEEVALTGPGEVIEDLGRLPLIPYELFPTEEWLELGRWYARWHPHPHWRFSDRVVNVHGGRGCPFKCNFCYHHSRPRYRSLAVAIGEARQTMKRFNANMLYFSDETTLPSPSRVQEMLCEMQKMPRRVEYSVSSRFDVLNRLDDGLLAEMKSSGCRTMGLGIESGSDRILKIIGKNATADVISDGLERLRRAGILPTVSIMVRQYTETVDDVEMSIALMRNAVRSNPNIQFAFTIATPFPGSQLYRMIFEKGLLKDDLEFFNKYSASPGDFKAVVNLSAMSDAEMKRMYEKMCCVCQKEKTRVLSRNTVFVERTIQSFAQAHEWFLAKVSGAGRRWPFFRRIYITELSKWCESVVYTACQMLLEKMQVRVRRLV